MSEVNSAGAAEPPDAPAKPTIEIKHRWTDAVFYSGRHDSLKDAVVAAVEKRADLSGADLRGAYLSGADLSGADLSGADLSGADLSGADLRGADLRGAYLRGADLSGAYLSGAYLRGAYLSGAYLRGADLSGAKFNWSSHDLIAEALRQAAGDDPEKRKFAGLVLVSRDWCWKQFLALDDTSLPWAIGVLSALVTEGDGAPDCLKPAPAGVPA